MTDYAELVKTLREESGSHRTNRIFDDAASAIESLQAEVERLQVDVEAAYALMEVQE